MGEVELHTITNELVIHSVFFFYGDAASKELSWQIANDISRHWNEPNASIRIASQRPVSDLWRHCNDFALGSKGQDLQ